LQQVLAGFARTGQILDSIVHVIQQRCRHTPRQVEPPFRDFPLSLCYARLRAAATCR